MKLIRSTIDLDSHVHVMGVLNLTPDSFSDGGRYSDPERAVERALEIEAEGAEILDVGGESSRPGATPVGVAEELSRVLPVLERLSGRLRIPISIDTTKSQVAREAIAAGAEMINDISGLRFDLHLAEVAAETGAALVIMHSRGTPETMRQLPPVADLWTEVNGAFRRALELALERGVGRGQLVLDPGLGFAKSPQQDLQLINGLDRIRAEFDLPILLGPSRKSFIRRTLEREGPAGVRLAGRGILAGTAASVAIGVLRGARMVRVHDVAEMVAVTRLMESMISMG
ncbi:MAG TPA: dihydropteroate synthase [Blastocatellia bacterium]|nr:dihydropteroate synthase [Blastocatellia bacterium]